MRRGVAAGVLVALTVVAGGGGTGCAARAARRQAAEADAAAAAEKAQADAEAAAARARREAAEKKAEPLEPKLLDPPADDAARVREMMERAAAMIAAAADRPLDDTKRAQLDQARGFLAAAKEALGTHELQRASVLAEKALVLLENLSKGDRLDF